MVSKPQIVSLTPCPWKHESHKTDCTQTHIHTYMYIYFLMEGPKRWRQFQSFLAKKMGELL